MNKKTRFHYIATVLLVALAIFCASRLGYLFTTEQQATAVLIWPPAGIGLAAVLLFGRRIWPAIALGALGSYLSLGEGLAFAIPATVGNTLEPLLGAYLLKRYVNFNKGMHRIKDVLGMFALAAFGSTTVSALIGATALSANGFIPWAMWPSTMVTWWFGDAIGVIVVAPLILVWSKWPEKTFWKNKLWEAFLLFSTLLITCILTYGGLNFTQHYSFPLLFLTAPILIWATMRFGNYGATAATTVLVFFSVSSTIHNNGPFSNPDMLVSLMLVWFFSMVSTTTTLILSVIISSRLAAEKKLLKTAARLSEAQRIVHLGSWEWDIASGELIWSDEVYRIFGCQPQEFTVTYEKFQQAVHPEDVDRVTEVVKLALEGSKPYSVEHRVVHADGQERIVQELGKVYRRDNGEPYRMVGTVQDITERKRAQLTGKELKCQLAVNDLALALADLTSLNSIYNTLYQHISAYLKMTALIVSLYDQEDHLLKVRHITFEGKSLDVTDFPSVPVGKFQEQLIRTGEPLYYADYQRAVAEADQAFTVDKEGTVTAGVPSPESDEPPTNSALMVPLKFEGEVTGVLQLQSLKLDAYTPTDIELLSTLANIVAIALRNAHHFDQVQSEITERKQAENALQEANDTLERKVAERTAELAESEALYKLLTEMTSDYAASMLVGKDGSLITEWVVGSYGQITGGATLPGRPANLERTHPDDRERLQQDIARTLRNEPTKTEYRYQKPEGTYIWLLVYRKPVWDETQQRVISFIAVGTDVTERKQAEEALKNSEKRFHEVVRSMRGSTWDYDPVADLFTNIDPFIEQIFGYPLEDWSNFESWKTKLHPEDREATANHCLTMTEQMLPHTFEYRVIHPDGKVIWIKDVVSLTIEDGKVTNLRGIFFDITQEKEAVDKLRKLSHAIEQSQSTVVITDIEGVIEYVNPQFTHVTGYSEEEAIGQNPRVLASGKHPPEFYAEMWNTLKSDRVWRGEMINKKKNGELYWEFAVISPVLNHEGETTHFVAVKEDISKRKQAEEALKDSEERYRTLMEESQVAMVLIDNGTVIYANEAVPRQLGYGSVSEIQGRAMTDFIAPIDHELLLSTHKRRLQGEAAPDTYELRVLHKDGRLIWVEMSVLLREHEGIIVAQASLHDVNERKLAQEEIEIQHAYLETIIESFSDPFYVIDLSDYSIVLANSAAKDGRDMAGMRCYQLAHAQNTPCDSKEHPCPIDEIRRTGTQTTVEHIHTRADGSEYPVEVHMYPIFDEHNQLVQAIEYTVDISARKQAETELKHYTNALRAANDELTAINEEMEAQNQALNESYDQLFESKEELRASQEVFRALSENSPYIIMRFDAEFRHLYVNPEAERVIGIPCQDFIGKTYEELRFPQEVVDLWDSEIQAVFDSGGSRQSQFSFTGADGPAEYDWHLIPEFGPDGTVATVLSTARDITKLIHIQKTLEQAQQKAEEANTAKSQFLSNMSHELRTPLSVINGLTEVLLDKGYGSLTPKQQTLLERMSTSGEHLLLIINDLLDLAKMEAGKMEIVKYRFDLLAMVREVCMLMEGQITAKGVELVEDGLGGTYSFNSDPLRLKQILINLVSNATKFTSEGLITVYFKEQGNKVVLGVKDTGIGIKQSEIERLFSPFEQIREAQKESIKGTGLGLALSRELTHSLGGEIGVESIVDKGSNFYIELPVQEGENKDG